MIYRQIEETRSIIKDIESSIAKQEKIKNSMLDTLVQEIRSICTPFSSKMLHAAWVEQDKKTKKERPMFEFVKSEILTRFFTGVKNVKLKQIISDGREHYGYSFRMDIDGVLLDVFVPDITSIRTDNLNYARYGMYAVLHKTDSVRWKMLTASYQEEEIRDAIKKWLGRE